MGTTTQNTCEKNKTVVMISVSNNVKFYGNKELLGRTLIIIENKIDSEDWSVMNMYKSSNSIKTHKAKAVSNKKRKRQ